MTGEVKKSVGVMQPYIFPYIGYFQLVAASDEFVFYDDVQYIKRGWINRNRLSSKGKDVRFSVPALGASRESRIMDVACGADEAWVKRLATSMHHEYRAAPNYKEVSELVIDVFDGMMNQPISELCIASVTRVMDYLEMPLTFSRSATDYAETAELRRADRIIAICKKCGGTDYINLPGGVDLYHTDVFEAQNIKLHFIQDKSGTYKQFDYDHIPKLSIIDVLMHRSKAETRQMMNEYALVARSEICGEQS